MKHLITYFIIILALAQIATSQEKEFVKKGNQLYKDKKYEEADIQYRKALDANSRSERAMFNLGDALYRQGNYEDAAKKYDQVASTSLDPKIASSSWHNLGNTYLQNKKYKESAEAFKKALRLNPNDDDARYNYEYSRRMMAMQQQQQNQDNKDQNGDQNKDQQQQNQGQDKKDNKGNQNQDSQADNKGEQDKDKQGDKESQADNKQDGKQGDEKQAQPKKDNKISEEEAKRILQALANEEKNVQKKVQKQKSNNARIEKNW